MPQTSMTRKPGRAIEGQRYSPSAGDLVIPAMLVTLAGVEAGRAVVRDATSTLDKTVCRALSAAADVPKIMGFSVFQDSIVAKDPFYAKGDMLPVMARGPIWLKCADDCRSLGAQAPYICYSGANAGMVQASATLGAINYGVRLREGANTGELTIADVNLPNVGNPTPTLEQTDEWTNPAAPAVAGLHAATATTVAVQVLLTADLVAGGVAALAAYPRNVTFTTAGGTAADVPATAAIVGGDIDGNALLETVTLAQTATVAEGVKAFKTITSITYAAGDGTGGTVAVGFGKKFGLTKSVKVAAGIPVVLQEIAVGVVVTTGTYVSPATSAPHGTYSPSADPDAAKDYALTYEIA